MEGGAQGLNRRPWRASLAALVVLALALPLQAQTPNSSAAQDLAKTVYGLEVESLRAEAMPRILELQAQAERLGSRGAQTQELVNYLVQLRKLAQLQDTQHTPVRGPSGEVIPRSQVEAEAEALRVRVKQLRRLGQLLGGSQRDMRGRFQSADSMAAEIEALKTSLGLSQEGLPLPVLPQVIRTETPEFINRELSFVEFNRRVVAQAGDSRVPLLERARFLSIASTNMDEFFGVRVSGLKQEVRAGRQAPRSDGFTPAETYVEALESAQRLSTEQYAAWNNEVVPALKSNGVEIVPRSAWDAETLKFVEAELPKLEGRVQELAVGAELPRLNDKAFYVVASKGGQVTHAVEVPAGMSQVLAVPGPEGTTRLILLSDLIEERMARQGRSGLGTVRVTRNADSWGRQGVADHRFGEPVRLEVSETLSTQTERWLRGELALSSKEVVRIQGPLNLQLAGEVVEAAKTGRGNLLYQTFTAGTRPEHQRLFETISKGDVLLHHPFQSFTPVVDLVRQAAQDAEVTEVRQSLYRTGGPNTPVVDALVEAAEAGKRVVVVIELKARFDEINNLGNVERLRKAGAEVSFGPVGHKVHAKMLQIVRREGGQLRRYTNLNTGNYNAGSARFYTDLSYMTKSDVVGRDVEAIFGELTGERRSAAGLTQVLRAPFTLQSTFLELIEAEAEAARAGREARITLKMNSLNDPKLIQALYAASQAGVQIDLIVRGVCTLRPGVPGLSENIRVRSVIGRLLEHSRVYRFHAGGAERTWIGSADWMVRNTERRVETAVEILDPKVKAELSEVLKTYRADNVQAWELRQDGRYERVEAKGEPERIAQQEMIERHRPRAEALAPSSLSLAPASWADELRSFDAGLREVHELGLRVIEGRGATVEGTSHGTVDVTAEALKAIHEQALESHGSAAEKAALRRQLLANALETAASELLAKEPGRGEELYRRGRDLRLAEGATSQVEAGEATARTMLGWLGKYRLPDLTLDYRSMAKDGTLRTLSSTGKFTLAIFLREFGYAVATRDRGRLEAFFQAVASTDFYVEYGLFVGGAFVGEVGYDLLHKRYLKPYLGGGTLNGVLRSNAALAGGLALPMLLRGEFDGQAFTISLASLGLSSFAVQGAMSRIPWVRRLQAAAAAGGRVARAGGWTYQAGELAIVLTIGGEIEHWAHGKLQRWEAEGWLKDAATELAQALARPDLDADSLAAALHAYEGAWDQYRVYLYQPMMAAQGEFKAQLQPFLRREALRDETARAAELAASGQGLSATLAERLQAMAARAREGEGEELRDLAQNFEEGFEAAAAKVYAEGRRDGPMFPVGIEEMLRNSSPARRAALFSHPHAGASSNRLQSYEDQREALDQVWLLVSPDLAPVVDLALERTAALAAADAAMFAPEASGGPGAADVLNGALNGR